MSRFAAVSGTSVSIWLPGIGASLCTVRKSRHGGVLWVNGDDPEELGVLKLEEPMSPSETGPSFPRFDALFAQFYPELFGLVYRVVGDRMETEDTLQEVFLKLADATSLQARPDAEVAAWL